MTPIVINDQIPRTLTRPGLDYPARMARSVPPHGLIADLQPLFGASSWVLARNAHPSVQVLGVDTWAPPQRAEGLESRYPGCPPLSCEAYRGYISDCTNIEPVEGDARAALPRAGAGLDLIFDGADTGPAFAERLGPLLPRLKAGGIVAGTNYGAASADVIGGVAKLAAGWGARPEVIGRVWALVKPGHGSDSRNVYQKTGPHSAHDIRITVRGPSGEEAQYSPQTWAGSLHEWRPLRAVKLDWAEPRRDGLSGACQLAAGQHLSDWVGFGEWAELAGPLSALRAHLSGPGSREWKLCCQACYLMGRRGPRVVTRNSRAFYDGNWTALEGESRPAGISALRCYLEPRGRESRAGNES